VKSSSRDITVQTHSWLLLDYLTRLFDKMRVRVERCTTIVVQLARSLLCGCLASVGSNPSFKPRPSYSTLRFFLFFQQRENARGSQGSQAKMLGDLLWRATIRVALDEFRLGPARLVAQILVRHFQSRHGVPANDFHFLLTWKKLKN
jgi:hypothetical protein